MEQYREDPKDFLLTMLKETNDLLNQYFDSGQDKAVEGLLKAKLHINNEFLTALALEENLPSLVFDNSISTTLVVNNQLLVLYGQFDFDEPFEIFKVVANKLTFNFNNGEQYIFENGNRRFSMKSIKGDLHCQLDEDCFIVQNWQNIFDFMFTNNHSLIIENNGHRFILFTKIDLPKTIVANGNYYSK